MYGLRQVRGYDNVAQRLHQAGGDFVDPDDNRRCVLDRPAAVQALAFEREANLRHRYTGREGDFEQTQGMNIWRAVSAQRFAMWEDGSWRLVRFVDQIEKDVVPQWDVAVLPRGPKQRSALASNDGWSIWKGSKVADEAWELLKFLQTDEFMELNARHTGNQPARKSYQDKWIKLIKETNPLLADKNLRPFVESIQQNYARPVAVFRKHPDALTIVNDQLFNGALYATETNKDIKNGGVALDAAVQDVTRRVNEVNR